MGSRVTNVKVELTLPLKPVRTCLVLQVMAKKGVERWKCPLEHQKLPIYPLHKYPYFPAELHIITANAWICSGVWEFLVYFQSKNKLLRLTGHSKCPIESSVQDCLCVSTCQPCGGLLCVEFGTKTLHLLMGSFSQVRFLHLLSLPQHCIALQMDWKTASLLELFRQCSPYLDNHLITLVCAADNCCWYCVQFHISYFVNCV